jgi:16S rRNA (uracil1498-N3)-methyltransferase
MRVHRLRVTPLDTGSVRVVGAAAHHLARVLRVQPGARIVAFDGAGGEAPGRVVRVEADAVWLELEAARASERESPRRLTLAAALLKGDRWEGIVRMGTELGVGAFVPLLTDLCDVRTLAAGKVARLARVAEESARQSGRAVVPSIAPLVALDDLRWEGAAIVADPRADLPLGAALAGLAETLVAITGPEGGFAPDEVQRLVERGAVAAHLGARILRADTAPVAIAAAWAIGGSA